MASHSIPKRIENKEESEINIEELKNALRQELAEEFKDMMKNKDMYQKFSENLRGGDVDDYIDIRPDVSIKVISVCPHKLCLTGEDVKHPYIFKKWGEVKRIPYRDVRRIIDNHRNFLEEGLFQIIDQNVIKFHALEDIYQKILDIDTMERIEDEDFSDAVKLLENATKGQQEVLVERVIQKLVNYEKTFSLDYLDKISHIVGYNIKERADNSIANKKIYQEEAEKKSSG